MAAVQAVRHKTAPALPEIDTTTALGAKDALIARLEKSATITVERAKAQSPEVRAALVKALKAYKRADYKAAVLRALEATRLDPQAAQAYHTLALSLEALGELHKALLMYERAMQLDPEDPEVYLNLGLVAWKLSMLEGAEKFFRLYVAMRPESHLGYNNLGGVLRDLTRFDEAIEILRGAIYRLPEKAELWNTLGTVAMEQGSIAEAQIFYTEALRLDPKLARTYHNIAYALSHTGPLDDALHYYDRALKFMGDDPELDRGPPRPRALPGGHGQARRRLRRMGSAPRPALPRLPSLRRESAALAGRTAGRQAPHGHGRAGPGRRAHVLECLSRSHPHGGASRQASRRLRQPLDPALSALVSRSRSGSL